jgi:outer membrane protein
MVQPFVDEVKIALEDLRVEGKWTYILEGGQGGAIVAADKNLDVTDRAIARLRAMPKPALPTGRADSTAKKPAGAPLNAPAGVRAPGSSAPPPVTKKPDTAATKRPG